jgi:hypothetical protein
MFDLSSTPVQMKDGNIHNVAITYNGSALSMSIDSMSVFNNLAVSLSPSVDASGNAYVGFGSRTGLYYENHDVLNWTFTVPEPGSGVLVGCGLLFVLCDRAHRHKRFRAAPISFSE